MLLRPSLPAVPSLPPRAWPASGELVKDKLPVLCSPSCPWNSRDTRDVTQWAGPAQRPLPGPLTSSIRQAGSAQGTWAWSSAHWGLGAGRLGVPGLGVPSDTLGWGSGPAWAGGRRDTCPGVSLALQNGTDHSLHSLPLPGIWKLVQMRTINVLLKNKPDFQLCFIFLFVCFKRRPMWQGPWCSPLRGTPVRGQVYIRPWHFIQTETKTLTYW